MLGNGVGRNYRRDRSEGDSNGITKFDIFVLKTMITYIKTKLNDQTVHRFIPV